MIAPDVNGRTLESDQIAQINDKGNAGSLIQAQGRAARPTTKTAMGFQSQKGGVHEIASHQSWQDQHKK